MPLSLRSALALTVTALAGLVLALGLPGPVGAIDAAKPTPCTGAPLLSDPTGDQELNPLFPLGATTSPPNMDITSVFLNYRNDKDGKKVLTANIEIANLDKSVPAATDSQGGVYYYVIYTLGDEVRFVDAHNTDGSEINYEYGVIDPDIGTYTTEGTTVGTFFDGAKGVVQIDVPEAAGGKAGDQLKGVIATTDGIDIGTDHGNGINNHADTAPDDASVSEPNGADYTVADCPAGAAPPPPTGTTTTPGPTPTTAPPPPSSSSPTVLPVKFPNSIGSARKAKKGKKLSFKATASEPITNLRLSLKKLGGKGATLASGRAASLKAGTTKVSIKVKKRLKKGVYTLIATGTASGKRLQVGQKVGLK